MRQVGEDFAGIRIRQTTTRQSSSIKSSFMRFIANCTFVNVSLTVLITLNVTNIFTQNHKDISITTTTTFDMEKKSNSTYNHCPVGVHLMHRSGNEIPAVVWCQKVRNYPAICTCTPPFVPLWPRKKVDLLTVDNNKTGISCNGLPMMSLSQEKYDYPKRYFYIRVCYEYSLSVVVNASIPIFDFLLTYSTPGKGTFEQWLLSTLQIV